MRRWSQLSARRTFAWDQWRAVGNGISESFGTTFFLLIAIEFFRAGTWIQACVASGGFLGMVLSPVLVFWVRQFRFPISLACAYLCFLAMGVLMLPVVFPLVGVYVVAGILALICATGCIPLMTQIYQQNYPNRKRGTLFGAVNRIKVMSLAVCSGGTGLLLKWDIGMVPVYLAWVSAAFALAGYAFFRIPSRPLQPEPGHYPYRSLRLLKQNRKFLWLIIVWMFMGFGNLMTMPLRIKVLVEERFGFEYSPAVVALLTGVIPPLTIFVFTGIWGRLFDRMNFFLLRMILNLLFMVSIGSYFLIGSLAGFVFGSFMLGLAFAGGNVAWSLWVTKIAPAGEVADYMSVHTMMTGVRGLLAPLVAIPLVEVVPLPWVIGISLGLVFISVLMLVPEVKTLHRRRKAYPLNEEIHE